MKRRKALLSQKTFLGGGAVFLFLLLCLIFLNPPRQPARGTTPSFTRSATTSLPVVFLLPHQDDELFMAGNIQQALASKRPVYVVMVTDGANSRARSIINGEDDTHRSVIDSLQHRRHFPLQEGYQPLTKQTFSEARNKEFFESMQALGVKESNILFANAGDVAGSSAPEYPNDALTPDLATEIVDHFYALLGDGTYCTVAAELGSINATHGDHFVLREALRRYKGIQDKRFFSEKIGVGHAVPLTVHELQTKRKALRAYGVWSPRRGRFAVGEHSVASLFDVWRKSQFEYVLDASELQGALY